MSKPSKPVLRRAKLKWAYGTSPEEYEAVLAAQGGGCAICGKGELRGRNVHLNIDHAHSTGKFRGILCDKCNVGLGNFKDSPERLRRAIAYLQGALQ